MDTTPPSPPPSDNAAGIKHKGASKTARIPIKVVAAETLKKPPWIRVRAATSPRFYEIKQLLRERNLHSVCEEASCPNIGECFSKGTATFMIMGDKCTRRCPFCDVGHGRPDPLDIDEPKNLARTIAALKLKYVVITSVDRDDLRDGGAQHFADCIRATRALSPNIKIEILTPDFRGKGRMERALEVLGEAPPDVFNHNLETVRELYANVRPGADYDWSLQLLQRFGAQHPEVPTKSGIMLGLGENKEQVLGAMADLRAHNVDMITIGQYLQPTPHHHPVLRYWTPEEFEELRMIGEVMGFSHVASGPMVRSSYHADRMAADAGFLNGPAASLSSAR
jgi:lipoic acid synthetase